MEQFTIKSYEAGVDYLTLISRNPDGLAQLDALGAAWCDAEEAAGGIVESRLVSGFDGYAVNQSFIGYRHGEAMLRVSGAQAALVCQAVDWQDVRASRIDVQVTVFYACDFENVANHAYYNHAWPYYKQKSQGRARPILIVGGGGGDTLNIGARSSQRFGRLYDKFRQSGDLAYENAWRWECEYKAEGAWELPVALCAGRWEPRVLASHVSGQWAYWGVPMCLQGVKNIAPLKLGRGATDTDEKLAWLAKQVRGTVEELGRLGRMPDVLIALGLDKSNDSE